MRAIHKMISMGVLVCALAYSGVATAQTDAQAASAAQDEIASILNNSRADLTTDYGNFPDAISFSVEIRSPCENTITFRQERVERRGLYTNARAQQTQFNWRYVTRVVPANIANTGSGTIGVAVYRGDEYRAYAVNNVRDQQRLYDAMERLRIACAPPARIRTPVQFPVRGSMSLADFRPVFDAAVKRVGPSLRVTTSDGFQRDEPVKEAALSFSLTSVNFAGPKGIAIIEFCKDAVTVAGDRMTFTFNSGYAVHLDGPDASTMAGFAAGFREFQRGC